MERPHPLCRCLDVAVRKVGVAQRYLHVGMAEQPGDHWHGYAVHYRMAGHGMAKVVKATVADPGFLAHAIPKSEIGTARPGGVER